MELYIIRHGQSGNNILEDETARSHDPALTDLGRQQAERLAAYLADPANRDPVMVNPATGLARVQEAPGLSHLYCSAMYRALQTTAPVAEALGLQPEVWLDIHEQGGMYLEGEGGKVGYPGRTRGEILSEFPNYVLPDAITDAGWYQADHGYEDLHEGAGRAIKVALELRRRAASDGKDQRIAIITHGTFIDFLLKALFGQLPNRQFFYLHYNTGITRLDFERDRMYVRYLNRVEHLPREMIS